MSVGLIITIAVLLVIGFFAILLISKIVYYGAGLGKTTFSKGDSVLLMVLFWLGVAISLPYAVYSISNYIATQANLGSLARLTGAGASGWPPFFAGLVAFLLFLIAVARSIKFFLDAKKEKQELAHAEQQRIDEIEQHRKDEEHRHAEEIERIEAQRRVQEEKAREEEALNKKYDILKMAALSPDTEHGTKFYETRLILKSRIELLKICNNATEGIISALHQFDRDNSEVVTSTHGRKEAEFFEMNVEKRNKDIQAMENQMNYLNMGIDQNAAALHDHQFEQNFKQTVEQWLDFEMYMGVGLGPFSNASNIQVLFSHILAHMNDYIKFVTHDKLATASRNGRLAIQSLLSITR